MNHTNYLAIFQSNGIVQWNLGSRHLEAKLLHFKTAARHWAGGFMVDKICIFSTIQKSNIILVVYIFKLKESDT